MFIGNVAPYFIKVNIQYVMKFFVLPKRFFIPLIFVISSTISFFVLSYSLKGAYESYWTAIYRVQTVDMNILANVINGSVKEVIQKANQPKAADIVNSNYCLFRIRITSCDDEQCQKQSEMADNADSAAPKRCTYLQEAEVPSLSIPIYEDSLIKSPVFFEHAYSMDASINESAQKTIGFVHLYRGAFISFTEDMKLFYKKLAEGKALSSRHISYKTATYVGVFIFFTLTLLFWVLRLMTQNYHKRKHLSGKLLKLIEKRM
ncbi:hypothetical protein [Thalassomonas sp. M1454]|uniref:hypothetical protein n=1 Tax=Thalassomonas sp. M1454 TaxID=2594477 RepID=UPI00117EAE02|nr:hypothetical protein [Thalassomonas sp. M1454]TRX57171.1 hypothetical protein FNN08_06645 [Thalassomonas sp. M1454]